ncbi:MAG: sigma-54-dependent Fis family transcriptional regulator [Deltaproteobacteria bacterium]|nr:MAG: sigma-54-dependent Fis family transcriptional regulator [Deltaproteobacteria bacterium]
MVKKSLTIIQARKKATIKKSAESDSFHGMIGSCGRMKKLFTLISRIADDEFATVLIRGESGTGKELVARAIHQHSQRKNRNFVPVNCAAIPDDLLESELFGHTKGAFTGASQNKQGRIQYADGGTLFLDEIGDMKGNLQAKLLRVLQEKEFEPIGALKPVPVNTRILAATHCDLEQMVEAGEFREDLYYRLSVIPLHIPALRERSGDLKLLIDHFIHKFTTKRGKKTFHFTEEAYTCLQNHRWRGNVRELENLVQHMSILYDGQSVNQADLPEKYQDDRGKTATPPPSPAALGVQPHERFTLQNEPEPSPEVSWDKGQVDFKQLINDFETGLILQALKMTGGNKKEAAALLNLKRTTLLEKIKKKELDEQLWRQ